MMENEPIDITKDELMAMVMAGKYNPDIVKSVKSKCIRGGKIVYTFTLQDGQVITI